MSKEYAKRNSLLKKMGYASYGDYLASELWASIRRRAYEKGRRCHLCLTGTGEIHLHHTSYALNVLNGQDITSLVPLCAKCHNRIEFGPNNIKRDLAGANYELNRLSKQVGAPQPAAALVEVKTKPKKVKKAEKLPKKRRHPPESKICYLCREGAIKEKAYLYKNDKKNPVHLKCLQQFSRGFRW